MSDRRSAFEWGLASTAVGGVLTIAAPLAVVAANVVEDDLVFYSHSTQRAVTLVGYVPALAAMALALAGGVFGVRSILASRRSRRPTALGLVGLMLGAAAVAAWACAGLQWYGMTIGWLSIPAF